MPIAHCRTYVSRTGDFVHFADNSLEAFELLLVLLREFEDTLLELALLALHAVGHVHDDLDASQVDAQLVDQPLDLLQMLDVLVGIEADVAAGASRIHQADALVVAQGLGMDAADARGHADNVVVELGGAAAPLSLPWGRPDCQCCHGYFPHDSRWRLSSWKSSRSRDDRLVGRITRTLE